MALSKSQHAADLLKLATAVNSDRHTKVKCRSGVQSSSRVLTRARVKAVEGVVAKNGMHVHMIDGVAIKIEPRHCTSPPDAKRQCFRPIEPVPKVCHHLLPLHCCHDYLLPVHHNCNVFIRIFISRLTRKQIVRGRGGMRVFQMLVTAVLTSGVALPTLVLLPLIFHPLLLFSFHIRRTRQRRYR